MFPVTHNGLSIAVLSGQTEVQPELVGADDVHITRLGPPQRVDTPVEGPVGDHLDGDPRVLTLHRHCGNRAVTRLVLLSWRSFRHC